MTSAIFCLVLQSLSPFWALSESKNKGQAKEGVDIRQLVTTVIPDISVSHCTYHRTEPLVSATCQQLRKLAQNLFFLFDLKLSSSESIEFSLISVACSFSSFFFFLFLVAPQNTKVGRKRRDHQVHWLNGFHTVLDLFHLPSLCMIPEIGSSLWPKSMLNHGL